MKKVLLTSIGWILLLAACTCWILVIIIPFVSIGVSAKVGFISVCIVIGEVLFWLGTLLVGKQVWNHFRKKRETP